MNEIPYGILILSEVTLNTKGRVLYEKRMEKNDGSSCCFDGCRGLLDGVPRDVQILRWNWVFYRYGMWSM